MGDYNPHAPQILGQEWAPIRDEDITFSPAVNAVELGHGFTLAQSRTLKDGRFYINEFAPSQVAGQVYFAELYPQGKEALSGPIQRVVIPTNSVATSGSGFLTTGGANKAVALLSPSDGFYINVTPAFNTNSKVVEMFFSTNQYSQLLSGKRILGVNLLYSMTYAPGSNDKTPLSTIYSPAQFLSIRTGTGSPLDVHFAPIVDTLGNSLLALGIPIGFPANNLDNIRRLRFGEVNHLWQTPSTTVTEERMPWRYEELQRFEASASDRYAVHIEFGGTTPLGGPFEGSFYLGYAALEIFYCEEQRLIWGGAVYGLNTAIPGNNAGYIFGTNIVTLRDKSFSLNPVLTAGAYSAVLSSADIGDLPGSTPLLATPTNPASSNTYPELNALRELYQIPPHPGVQVNIPLVIDETAVGKVFTKKETHILPQISLHTSGGPLTEVHVYGRQAAAQVYGTVTATQEIQDGLAGGSASWPWVRYIARRFGNTIVPLTLTGAGQSVTITPAEHDALKEILDDWKEVTLRFATPPVMGAGTQPQFIWSAAGETSGNRWEVLGAVAPALSGIAGNLLNQVPSPNQLSIATYGQPVSGASINLGWVPQGISGPPVSGTADDETADAFIIFAKDMPAVTGFTVTTLNQAVTGIGQNCGINPCCIPSGIQYNKISWNPMIGVSGFGYFEIQRMDAVESQWKTILKGTNSALISFNDYEARVGILSSYQIRLVDVYKFPGPWSSTVNATITSPGVTGGCLSGSHVLIFTSNQRQNGSINLAYSSAWMDQRVEEDFTFSEAGFVQLQAMYNRDFFTAFRPLERGGERFQRTVLVQAAAIAPETLGDFTGLRNMAWDSVNYICVRDEDGNRWFATVLVPSGRVLRDRRLYLAPVDIIEVTDTPTPVDPSV